MSNMAVSELSYLLCLWAELQPGRTVCRASHMQRRGGWGGGRCRDDVNEVTPQLYILYIHPDRSFKQDVVRV